MIEYSDILELFALYAGFVTVVFAVSYAAGSLFTFFKSLANPGWRDE